MGKSYRQRRSDKIQVYFAGRRMLAERYVKIRAALRAEGLLGIWEWRNSAQTILKWYFVQGLKLELSLYTIGKAQNQGKIRKKPQKYHDDYWVSQKTVATPDFLTTVAENAVW